MTKPRIVDIRAHVLDQPEIGGDYNRREAGHWLVDDLVAMPTWGGGQDISCKRHA